MCMNAFHFSKWTLGTRESGSLLASEVANVVTFMLTRPRGSFAGDSRDRAATDGRKIAAKLAD